MKTCRFCLHQQENGDRCEACGSPFSADKLDFSEGLPEAENGFPDPTASQLPDPTVSSMPDPTVSSMPDPTVSPVPAPAVAAAGTTAPAVAETPSRTADVPVTQTEETPAERSPEEPKKIMYSAAVAGETVYLKSKGGNKNITSGAGIAAHAAPTAPAAPAAPTAPAPQMQSYTPPAAPLYVSANQSADASKYSGLSTHSLVTFIISCAGLLCLCGMSIPSLVMSLIAFLNLQSVKAGTANGNVEGLARRAKVLTIISDVWLILSACFLFIAILLS